MRTDIIVDLIQSYKVMIHLKKQIFGHCSLKLCIKYLFLSLEIFRILVLGNTPIILNCCRQTTGFPLSYAWKVCWLFDLSWIQLPSWAENFFWAVTWGTRRRYSVYLRNVRIFEGNFISRPMLVLQVSCVPCALMGSLLNPTRASMKRYQTTSLQVAWNESLSTVPIN